MKPRNFPGRKNDRRIRALTRMALPPRGLSPAMRAEHPFEITRLRIIPDTIARSVRTKKDRTNRAKLAH
jgi:hypothetical protein